MERRAFLADRLNTEPLMLFGCTSSEFSTLVIASAVVWIPLAFVIAGSIGAWSMGFGIVGIGMLATVYVAALVLRALKRNRPDGFYVQWIVIRLHESGLRKSRYIRRTGYWDIGRRIE